MKKWLIALGIVVLMAPPVCAELKLSEVLDKLPALKQGIAFDIAESDGLSFLSTLELIKWKGISLEAGYSSTDKIVGVISYQLLRLKDLGVTVPILDLLEANVGFYLGYSRVQLNDGFGNGNNEQSYGPSLTLISTKW